MTYSTLSQRIVSLKKRQRNSHSPSMHTSSDSSAPSHSDSLRYASLHDTASLHDIGPYQNPAKTWTSSHLCTPLQGVEQNCQKQNQLLRSSPKCPAQVDCSCMLHSTGLAVDSLHGSSSLQPTKHTQNIFLPHLVTLQTNSSLKHKICDPLQTNSQKITQIYKLQSSSHSLMTYN